MVPPCASCATVLCERALGESLEQPYSLSSPVGNRQNVCPFSFLSRRHFLRRREALGIVAFVWCCCRSPHACSLTTAATCINLGNRRTYALARLRRRHRRRRRGLATAEDMSRMRGIPQKTGVKLCLMDWFSLFQVIVRASCTVLDQIAHKTT